MPKKDSRPWQNGSGNTLSTRDVSMLKFGTQLFSFIFVLLFSSRIYDLKENERLFGSGLSRADSLCVASPCLKDPFSRRELSKPPIVKLASTLFLPSAPVSLYTHFGL